MSAPVPQLDHLRAWIVERAAAEGPRRQPVGAAPFPRLIRHDHTHGLHRSLVPLTEEVARALDQEVVNEEPTVLNSTRLRPRWCPCRAALCAGGLHLHVNTAKRWRPTSMRTTVGGCGGFCGRCGGSTTKSA